MLWNELSRPWQAAFEQGWTAFKIGSIPIGAVITDENDVIISEGRNRIYDTDAPNPKIAHAEMECLQKLNTRAHPDVKKYTVYTSMEPCPMCFGTIVMSDIIRVKIAARDSHCGAAHYCMYDPYIASHNMQVSFEGGVPEAVQLTLQSYFELRFSSGNMNKIILKFRECSPASVNIAEVFYNNRYLDNAAENGIDFSEIFNTIASII